MTTINIWEEIHSSREWGKYPNEEFVRFIGKNYFFHNFDARKNIRILEIGCGQGANLWFIAKEGFDVYGIDISQLAIQKTSRYLANLNLNANLKVVDMKNTNYPDAFFDVIFDCAAIQHSSFTDHKVIYDEIFRLLKPNGRFWTFHVTKGCYGEGCGTKIEDNSFTDISEGPLSGKGVVCFPSDTEIKELQIHSGFCIDSCENLTRTFNNQKNTYSHWIIESRK